MLFRLDQVNFATDSLPKKDLYGRKMIISSRYFRPVAGPWSIRKGGEALPKSSVSVFVLLIGLISAARADVVTDPCARTTASVEASKMPTAHGNRVIAIGQTAVYEAVISITKRYPSGTFRLDAPEGASIPAAVAAAKRSGAAQDRAVTERIDRKRLPTGDLDDS